ncbi:MAG: site-specific integrase [Streptosporangiaceae bacterium]|nr:site-specific integrase [Streptosporangiaceae bacterium]
MTTTRQHGQASGPASSAPSSPPPAAREAGPAPAPWPQTVLSADELTRMAWELPVGSQAKERRFMRRAGTRRLLAWLETWPGTTWQERWEASGSEAAGGAWIQAPARFAQQMKPGLHDHGARSSIASGMSALLCLGVLRPGYVWMFAARIKETYGYVRELTDPKFFTEAVARCRAGKDLSREQNLLRALNHISRLIIGTGRGPRELTARDVAAYHATLLADGPQPQAITLTWDILLDMGVITAAEHGRFRNPQRKGRQPVEDLVDQYELACRPVRDVLVRYLRDRAVSIDYSSLLSLTQSLASAFWKDLETHHPGVSSLRLAPDAAQGWKDRLAASRSDPYGVLFTVRAFYLDLPHKALEDPWWAPWTAPSPVTEDDIRGFKKYQRHRTARMHQRTRTLAPVLPRLAASVEDHLRETERLHAAASSVAVGEVFTIEEDKYERIEAASDRFPERYRGARRLRVRHVAGGQALDLTKEEDRAFWTWAIVETLRLTGVRLEEMLEITHLALVTRVLPDTGEVIPLLQIAPSKADAERLLLVSPELAHVLARIIARVRGGSQHIPLVARYDYHERTTGAPLPHLFQRQWGPTRQMISPNLVKDLLNQALERAGLTGPDGTPLHYTPHDFRRIFASDAVSGGLPVHIAAKLLGHHDLATTQRYVAVYQDDVLRHYAAFIARRRAERPSEEYREPTEAEWNEFEQHFTRRKVELGTCARPYGTPCRHEHACIRCPMLRVDPLQGVRLAEIITSLHERIREATERGWLGEIEGLQVSLDAARQKMEQIRRIRLRGTPLELGPTRRLPPAPK